MIVVSGSAVIFALSKSVSYGQRFDQFFAIAGYDGIPTGNLNFVSEPAHSFYQQQD